MLIAMSTTERIYIELLAAGLAYDPYLVEVMRRCCAAISAQTLFVFAKPYQSSRPRQASMRCAR